MDWFVRCAALLRKIRIFCKVTDKYLIRQIEKQVIYLNNILYKKSVLCFLLLTFFTVQQHESVDIYFCYVTLYARLIVPCAGSQFSFNIYQVAFFYIFFYVFGGCPPCNDIVPLCSIRAFGAVCQSISSFGCRYRKIGDANITFYITDVRVLSDVSYNNNFVYRH